MNATARELAEMMYRASVATGDAAGALAFRIADLYGRATAAEIQWAERYVRSCLVAQRRA